jgi:hypothetical protein
MAPIQDGLISHMNKTTYAEMQKPPSEGQDVEGEERRIRDWRCAREWTTKEVVVTGGR